MQFPLRCCSSHFLTRFACILLLILSPGALSKPTLSVDDFTSEPDFRSAKISPNGRYMASLWSADDLRYLTIRDLSKPELPVVGMIGDKIKRPKSITWANDERLLVTVLIPYDTRSVERKAEREDDFDINDYFMFERVVSMNLEAKDIVVLMEDQRALRWNTRLSNITKITNDTQHVLMTGWKDNSLQLYKVNVYTGKSERIARGGFRTYSFMVDENGNPIFRFDYYYRANKVIIRKFLDQTKWEKIDTIDFDDDVDDENNGLRIEDMIGLYNQHIAYRKRNEKTGYYEIVVRNVKTKEITTLVSLENKDVEGVITNNSQEIIGYFALDDVRRFQYFDKKKQIAYDKLAKHFPHYNFSFHGEENDKLSVIKTFGRDMPGSFYLYDHNKDELTLIQHSYHRLPQNKLAIPAQVTFRARDELKISTNILLPPNYKQGKSYPMVIVPHGGPHARDNADYDDFAQFIATRGYLVVQPNFRGSTGYGKEFEEKGYKEWGKKMQEDLEDAANFMVTKGYADKNKICIAGISYGGYAALMGTVKTPELFKCSISINGVTHIIDQMKFDIRTSDYDEMEELLHSRIGNPKTDEAILNANSPALQVEKIRTPILLIASTEDNIVPYSQAKTMLKALKRAKKEYKFIKLEDSGHNPFVYTEDQELVYKEVETFLAKHLN